MIALLRALYRTLHMRRKLMQRKTVVVPPQCPSVVRLSPYCTAKACNTAPKSPTCIGINSVRSIESSSRLRNAVFLTVTVSFVDGLVAAQLSSDHSKGGFKDRYPHPHSSHRPHRDIAGAKPRKVLLGAIAFIVAITVAITGAIDSTGIATPEPTAM